jgi:hypothetical protein
MFVKSGIAAVLMAAGFAGQGMAKDSDIAIRPNPIANVLEIDSIAPCPRCPDAGADATADAGRGVVRALNRGGSGLVQTVFSPTYAPGQVCTSLNHSTPQNTYLTVLDGTFTALTDYVELAVSAEGRLTKPPGVNVETGNGLGGIAMRVYVWPASVANPSPADIVFNRWVISQPIRDSQIIGLPSNLHNPVINPIMVPRLVEGLSTGVDYKVRVQVFYSSLNTSTTFDTTATNLAAGMARGALLCTPQVIVSQYVP